MFSAISATRFAILDAIISNGDACIGTEGVAWAACCVAVRAFFRTGLALLTTPFTALFAVAILSFWLEAREGWRGRVGFCVASLTKLEEWWDVSGDLGITLERRDSVLDMLRVVD